MSSSAAKALGLRPFTSNLVLAYAPAILWVGVGMGWGRDVMG